MKKNFLKIFLKYWPHFWVTAKLHAVDYLGSLVMKGSIKGPHCTCWPSGNPVSNWAFLWRRGHRWDVSRSKVRGHSELAQFFFCWDAGVFCEPGIFQEGIVELSSCAEEWSWFHSLWHAVRVRQCWCNYSIVYCILWRLLTCGAACFCFLYGNVSHVFMSRWQCYCYSNTTINRE